MIPDGQLELFSIDELRSDGVSGDRKSRSNDRRRRDNEDGENSHFTKWRKHRWLQQEAMAQKLGLPLGREVEVTLVTGPVFRGRLRFAEDRLWIEASARMDQLVLRIGRATFTPDEIESCERVE